LDCLVCILTSTLLLRFLFLNLCPVAKMFKGRLQEYTQKNSFPLPVYDTVNEGQDHIPRFKCNVTVNGARYDSPPGFNHKKPAQNAAAEAAVKNLFNQGLLPIEEVILPKKPKNVLEELALKKNMPPPSYKFSKEGEAHCPTFTAIVEINGAFYAGDPANSKKDATNKAACKAIRAIDPHYFQAENIINNGSEHPTEECDVSKSDSKIPADNWTSNNQIVGGSDSHLPANCIEKVTVENAPAVEKISEKRNVENPCGAGEDPENSKVKNAFGAEKSIPNINHASSVPAKHPQQDPLLARQGQLKEEIADAHPDKQHGSQEVEGKQQGSQEVDLTVSISKRSISESENAEQMSERKKKHKRNTKVKRMKKQSTD